MPGRMAGAGGSSVTIRKAILRGYLALVLAAVLLSGALSFYQFRLSLQTEIAHNLGNSAVALSQRIDTFVFERLADLREWHRLELMQDIRVGDLDKRLAHLLADLRAGHGGVYAALFCTDRAGRVVAASEAGMIGQLRPPGPELTREGGNGAAPVILEHPDATRKVDRLVMRIAIPDAFTDGELGTLYAELDWREVGRFLQESVAGGSRSALLLGADGQAIAAAGPLAAEVLHERADLTAWYRDATQPEVEVRTGLGVGAERLLVGSAASAGYQHFTGFGWHLLVVEPTRIAFAPVRQLAWTILAVLLGTLLAAGWLSLRLSARIASPIARLTAFARGLSRTRKPEMPRVETPIAEVGDLCRAFAEMIEALERSREHLVRAGKLAVVGEMAAIMAHEVRTPLGILKSSAQMLQRRPGLTEQDRELTGFIVEETERLNRLVTTLLECASPRPPQFQPQDLHTVLEHVLALVGPKAEKKGLALERHLEARQSVLSCDREQMIQVFLNLLVNALQLVPEGGRLALASADTPEGIEVRVEDDGPGVAPEDRPRLFDPFFTRREGGIGLGLTIVQQIVEAHGGEIAVSESRWGGACFSVRLPAGVMK